MRLIAMIKRCLTYLVAGLLVGGCATVAPYADRPLPVAVPEQWQTGQVDNDGAPAMSFEPVAWLAEFDSPALRDFIAAVLANNVDIKTAATRMELARQNLAVSSGKRWPQLAAELEREKSRTDAGAGSYHEQTWSGLLSVSWELDLWGRLADLARADGADYQAAVHDYQSARLSFVAQTVNAWLRSVGGARRLELLERTCNSLATSETRLQRYYQQGLVGAGEVRELHANVVECDGQLNDARQNQHEELRQLRLLAGSYPTASPLPEQPLPVLDKPIPAGLPAALLERRGDILAAKQRIMALDARTLAAQKSLLPSLSLTASGGRSSGELHKLLGHGGRAWDLVTNLTLPLFQGGALRGQIAASSSEARLAWLNYEKVVFNAFAEVENALDQEQLLCQRQQALQANLSYALSHERSAWQHYLGGATDLGSLLAAQRQTLAARRELLELKTRRLVNRVALHLALGGSFSSPIEEPKRR